MNNKEKVNKNNLVLMFFNLIYIFALIFYYYEFSSYYLDFKQIENIIFPWVVMSLALHLINFKYRKYKLYDFGMWFILLSYLFLFGLLFREYFSMSYSLIWNPIELFSKNELIIAYFFSLISLNTFSIGYFFSKKNYKKDFDNDSSDNIVKAEQMYKFGILLVLLGGTCMLINDFKTISILKTYNSYLGYKYVNGNSIIDDLNVLFLPGLFLLFYSGKISEKNKRCIFVITIIYFVVIMILTGSRKVKLFSIISLFLGYVYSRDGTNQTKKVNLFRLLIYILGGFILLNVLFTIRDNRFDLSSIGSAFINNLFEMRFLKNIFGEVFSETGLTFLSIASIMKVVPSIFPFQYGLTFLKTIPSFLPLGWLIGDFFNGASSTNVINAYTNLPLGSSLIGDFYWNFGFIGGGVSSLIFGILFGNLFNVNNKKDNKIGMAIYFCLFSQLLVLVRAEFFDIFRPLVIILLISFLLRKTNFPLKGAIKK